MKKIAIIAFAAAGSLALAACGKSDDASDAATADNVEMPADEMPAGDASMDAPAPDAAMTEAPAADASAAAATAADKAQQAADSAADVAAAAKAAAAEAEQKTE